MATNGYEISRTLRCKNLNVPGTLSKLATAIARAGGNIGNITTVHLGHHYTVRDIEVFVSNRESLSVLLDEVSRLKEVTVLEVRDHILDFHEGGKIKVVNAVHISSLEDLRKVYTPGVAEVCNLIKENLTWKDKYTSIPYSIAIVTDGTAVLGLGNIGPLASMPVMEGKAALIYHLTGVSMVPILLDTTDPDEIVETVKHIAITWLCNLVGGKARPG
jgi:malate dehydrogenase (oxaloacetate-decarboxylating)